MRKTLLSLILMMGMMAAAALQPAAEAAIFGPQVFMPEKVFEFRPVVKGSRVVHEFVIQNRGNAGCIDRIQISTKSTQGTLI